MAERICRETDRVHSLRMLRSPHCLQRGASAPGTARLRYYNETRTHRSLHKDAPVQRSIQRIGTLKSRPILGGLHHRYVRI
jgi:hypothetical protein